MSTLVDIIPLAYTDVVIALGAAVTGILAGVVGTFAVLSQRSLLGDALAHATLPGVCLAFILTGTKDPVALLVGAAVAGLVGVLAMRVIETSGRIRPDAAIGVILSGFFAVGIVLLTFIARSDNAHQAGLETFLFGQAAGLLERDVYVMATLALAAIIVVIVGHRALSATLFDRWFTASLGMPVRWIEVVMTALLIAAIIAGVRVVGAILMVAMLITPCIVARQLSNRLSGVLIIAGAIGGAFGASGALVSTAMGAPTGPVIVLIGFCVAMVVLLMTPGRGVAWSAVRRRHRRRARLREGALLDLGQFWGTGSTPTIEMLVADTGHAAREIRRAVRGLSRDGLVERHPDGTIVATEEGKEALNVVRRQRTVWNAWLERGHEVAGWEVLDPGPRDVERVLGSERTKQLLALCTTPEAEA